MAKQKQSTAEQESPNFEASLNELEAIVARLETGDLSLENSLKEFERGVELTRNCHQALQKAELRVQQLVDEDGQLRFEDFDVSPDS